MTFTTPQVFTEDCRVLNCSFLNCSSSTDGGSMLFTHDTLEIIQTEFSRSSSDQSGGSIAFRCRQAHIKECDFRLSECRHFGGAIFSAGENTNIASSVFSFSHSDGDGGSLCSTCKTATISNSRFVASISDKNGGGIWLTSTHVSIYFSLCSDCVSKTGGSSLHALSGSTGTIFQSSFIATSVDVSLLFLETNSDFTFPNCNFGVESPDHDGSDLIYKGIPNPLTASQNVGLSSSTPNNTFRPVISQLVPSLRFDEFYSVDNPQFRVSQTGEDFNCKMTHFCKTLTAAVHLLKENFHNIIFLLSGTFPTAKIETNVSQLTLHGASDDDGSHLIALSDIVFHVTNCSMWQFYSVAFHRTHPSTIIVLEMGMFTLYHCSFFDSEDIVNHPCPFIKLRQMSSINIDTDTRSDNSFSRPGILSLEKTAVLMIRTTLKGLVVDHARPIIETEQASSLQCHSSTIEDCVVITPLCSCVTTTGIHVTFLTIQNSTFHSPLFVNDTSLDNALIITINSAIFRFTNTSSTSPLVSVTGKQKPDSRISLLLQNTTIIADLIDCPLLIRTAYEATINPSIENNTISVAGPLAWCDETNRELFVSTDKPTTLICSPIGEDTLSCGSVESPCRTTQWSVSLSLAQRPTTIKLPSSVQEGDVVLFNRRLQIEGESSDVIISAPSNTPITSVFILRFTESRFSSLIIHLTSSDASNAHQFADVQDTSVLLLADVMFFITSVTSLSRPPISIQNGSFSASALTTTFSRVSQLSFSSSLIRASNCHNFALSDCVFDRLSFGDPIVVLNSSTDGKFELINCHFLNLNSLSTCLFNLHFSTPPTVRVTNCVFESCSYAGSEPSLVSVSLPSTSSIMFSSNSCSDENTAILLLDTPNLTDLLEHSEFLNISSLLPTQFLAKKDGRAPCFVSHFIHIAETIRITQDSKDTLSCVSPEEKTCLTLQHTLQCLEDSPLSSKIRTIHVESVTAWISDSILVTSRVVVTSNRNHFMLLLSTPVESSDPVFIVTGSLTLDSLSFVMFKSIERHQPLIHGTPESRVSISFVSFEWDEVSITTPLILVTSATLHLKTTNFQFDCIVSAPVISSTLSPVYLDGVTFSGPTLKSDGRFIQLHETVKFYCKNLFMEDIMSEAPSALSIQLNEGSIDISQTTISEVTLFSENASVVSITASQAYVVLSWISVSQVSSAKTNASQIRISLHNSVLRLEDAVLQSYFDDSSSSALVVVTDSPEQLHIHVDLMTSLQTSEISPSLLLIGPFIKEHLAQICRGIVSRTFHPSAALWKNNENEEGRLLFADEMVSRTSFHVCDVGLDRLSCGAPSQPCQSLSYSLLLPHSSTETSFVLIGSVHLSTSVYLDDESIMLVGGREGSSLLSIDPSSGFFNSISMESIYVKDLTLQLDGNDVLESEPFISVNAGELEVYMCSVEVTSGNWDFAVLSVTDGKGKLFGLHVYSLSPSLPVILTAIRSSVFLAAIQSYTHSVNIPLVSLEEMDHQTLTIDGWKQDSPRAVWECPLFESDALLTDTSFEFLNLEMKNHVLANTAFLFDLSFTNSSIVFSFCSFTGIVPQSTALAEGSLASSHLLRLTLILSDFELTHCSFVSCSRSDEICLTLISLELYNTVVSVTNNSFSQCNSNSLVIQHPSFHTLIRHSSFISNTFNNTPDPVLEWDGVQQSLLRLISNYHRTLIGIGVLVGLLILLLLSILLVFPFFCITRQCASRPPVFRFWWRDGGESAKVDTRDPELIGRLAKPTHQFIYLYQNDLESLKRGRVDGRWRGLIVLI